MLDKSLVKLINRLDMADLLELNSLVKRQWKKAFVKCQKEYIEQKAKQLAIKQQIGDIVSFRATHNRQLSGTIIKINAKSIKIDCGIDGKWSVSPNFII